jgi:hypothetical protein
VSVDDVGDLEARATDLSNTPELVVELVTVELVLLGLDVREDAVAAALADVESLAVAGVDKPVDVGLQLGGDFRRE